jgi:hypothetical protein
LTITTYTDLKGALADWVERGDLADRLPTFIAHAEAKANRLLRERRQQAQSTASIGASLTALPADFREAITVELKAEPLETYERLRAAPFDALASFDDVSRGTGRPGFWSVLGQQLMLHPTPDQAYAVRLTYFAKLPALGEANPSNWLLEDGPDVYLDGALAAFHEWNRDWEAANRHLQKFEAGLAELMAQRRAPPAALRAEPGLSRARGFDINSDI